MKNHKKKLKKARKIMMSPAERSKKSATVAKTSIWDTSVWRNNRQQKRMKVLKRTKHFSKLYNLAVSN